MAGRSPIGLIREYLEPGEPVQVRKNALSALAALHHQDSLHILADVAATDADVQVRERAEQELAKLDPPDAEIALERVLGRLQDPATRRPAHVLLGRLRDAGMSFRFPALPFVSRLLLARSLNGLLYERRGFFFHFRTLKGMSVGGLVGWLVMAFYMGPMLGQTSAEWMGVAFGFYILTWLLLVLVGVIAFRYTVPARLQPDTVGGTTLDIGMVVIATMALTALAVFVDVYNESHKGYDGIVTVLVAVPVAAIAVRLGTLAVFGVHRNRSLTYLAQIVCGGLCGMVAYDLVAIVGSQTPRVVGLGAVYMVFGSFALAGAYADIDRRSRPAPVVPRPVLVGALALATAAVLISAAAAIPLPEARIDLGRIEQLPRTVDVRQVPAVVTYSAAGNTELAIDNSLSYQLEPREAGAGRYEARITRKTSTDTDEVWAPLAELSKTRSWGQLKARLTRTAPTAGPALVRAAVVSRECNVTPIARGTSILDGLTTATCPVGDKAEAVRQYLFTNDAGQPFEVTVKAQFDTSLTMFRPDGVRDYNDDTNGLNPRIQVEKPQLGMYRIEVRSFGATGTFTLDVQ